jgi:hypothetical protein
MDINENIRCQYQAALEMLKQAVIQCPEGMWADPAYRNSFWRVAYHTLFYAHLYLQSRGEDFVQWEKHRPDYHLMQPGGEAYNKADILEYFELVRQQVDEKVPASDPDAPSGFGWLPFNRLETHLYNIRHIQQHTGELSERLGVTANIDVDWVTRVRS